MSFYSRVGVDHPFDEKNDFVTSPFFSPVVLACLRLTLALYALCTAVVVLAIDTLADEPGYFSYFTHLTYIGLVAYFFATGVQTLAFVFLGRKGYPLQRWPRVLQFLHSLLTTTIVTFPFLVTIVFWTLLTSPDTFSSVFNTWSNVSQHAMNAAFALFEILFTNIQPLPWLHMPFCILLLGGYVGVAYITAANEGFYVYSFLNPAKTHRLLAAYIVGIAVGECIIFVIVWGIIKLRCKFFPRREQDWGGPGTRESSQEWQEVRQASISQV